MLLPQPRRQLGHTRRRVLPNASEFGMQDKGSGINIGLTGRGNKSTERDARDESCGGLRGKHSLGTLEITGVGEKIAFGSYTASDP